MIRLKSTTLKDCFYFHHFTQNFILNIVLFRWWKTSSTRFTLPVGWSLPLGVIAYSHRRDQSACLDKSYGMLLNYNKKQNGLYFNIHVYHSFWLNVPNMHSTDTAVVLPFSVIKAHLRTQISMTKETTDQKEKRLEKKQMGPKRDVCCKSKE